MFKQSQAYLMGYYGMKNTGDDILMYTSRWGIQNQLGDTQVKVSCLADVKCEEFGNVEGLPTSKFRGHHRFLHYKNALQSEKVIFGGGSVLHSEKDIQFKRHLVRLAGAKQSRCVGVGIGPFESKKAENACRLFLNECGFIGVRDPESYALGKALAPNANIHLTFDLAPLLLCDQDQKWTPIERKGVMFNFCQLATDAFGNVNEKNEQQRIDMAVQSIESVWHKTHEPIYLLDFNGHEQFGDFHVHQKIMQRVSDDVVITHIPYDHNPLKVLQRIAGFKATVAMRLHAVILSFLVNTPVISINYHNKCRSWCKQVGVPEQYQFEADDIAPELLASQLAEGFGTGFAKTTLNPEEARVLALRNWS